jgi:hypothetical protein
MFVRFRQMKTTLQVTLLVGRRVNGRVRHQQVAALGSVKLPLDLDRREGFWRRLHERLGRLRNRLDAAAQAKIMREMHARVPTVTADERREHEVALAEGERRLWDCMRDLLAERAAGLEDMTSKATASSAEARKSAEDAEARSAAAAERLERWCRGEDAPRGKAVDFEQILRDAGWTAADLRHARVLAALPEEAVHSLTAPTLAAGERAKRVPARGSYRRSQR